MICVGWCGLLPGHPRLDRNCERERERDRDRQTDTERERERERETERMTEE